MRIIMNQTPNLYIKRIPATATETSILRLASNFGNAISAHLQDSGIGFVLFETVADAIRGIEGLNLLGFDCTFAKETNSTKLKFLADKSSANLYFANLPLGWDELDLIRFLAPTQVLSARMLRYGDCETNLGNTRSDNATKGVGFARLNDRDAAESVIRRLQHFQFDCNGPFLQIRIADSRGQRIIKRKTLSGSDCSQSSSSNNGSVTNSPMTSNSPVFSTRSRACSVNSYSSTGSQPFPTFPNSNQFANYNYPLSPISPPVYFQLYDFYKSSPSPRQLASNYSNCNIPFSSRPYYAPVYEPQYHSSYPPNYGGHYGRGSYFAGGY